MRKFLSALLLCAFLLALTTSLTGCKCMVTEGKLKSMIEKALKEKYKEEFECIRILPNQNFSGSYTGVCYPVNDRELMFESRMYADGRYDLDYYPTSIVARELSKLFDDALGNIWEEHFTYAYTNRGIHDNETTQKIINNEFTLNYYLKHSNEVNNNSMQVNYRICIDTSNINVSYSEEWDSILNALNSVHEIGLDGDMDLYFRLWIYFVPTDVYTQCLEYFERNAQVRSLEEIVEGYPPEYNKIIHFDVGSKTWNPLTKVEYIELRKEID